MMLKRQLMMALAGCLLALVLAGNAYAQDCDRACLYGYLDQYMAALAAHDPGKLPLADNVRFTENNVEMHIPDGLWTTFSRMGDYQLKFADVPQGQAGMDAVIFEHDNPAILALRLKVEDGKISEIESLVGRYEEGRPFPSPFPLNLKPKPILEAMLPEADRSPRDKMVALANGYFDTLQQNDGTIHTKFDPKCDRVENGIETTNNAEKAKESRFYGMGCEEQFKLGLYRYDDRIRDRRFMLVDEERGLVWASGFIDHSGRLLSFPLTDGTTRQTHYKTPHSFHLMELFKIVDGKIRQVEAVFNTVPYNMQSPWVK
jgi:hypothetical protein